MDDFDADSIRARRALLISTALAALHCGGPSAGEVPNESASAAPTLSVTHPSSSEPVGHEKVPPTRPWADVLVASPPRGVPSSITGPEKKFLEQQETSLNARYALVREVWDATPGCDPGEAACRPDWRALGAKFKAMYQSERGGRGPRCGGPRYGSGSVAAREREHSRYLSKLVDEVDAHLMATADAYSPKSAQEWLRLAANAKEQPPMPCLSCAAPEFSEMTDSVPFEKDSSSLPADASRLSAIMGTYRSNRVPVKVVVRGHADAKEHKAAELAKARANAVAAWLEKNGIPKDRIEARNLDTSLPIGRSEVEEGAALNRRVDFEVVRL